MTAKIHEIFTSIQGEGVYSGKRQLFVRFYGCNLKCAFCDTSQGESDMKEYTEGELFGAICQMAQPASIHSISFTGGEPLLQSEFLKEFLPKLKQAYYRIYLETNGTLPRQLAGIIDYVDIVAMDIKLASSTKETDFWREHSEFLRISMKKSVFVKVVITDRTAYTDFYKAVALVRRMDPHIAFIIQPVTPQADVGPAGFEVLEDFKNIASEHLNKVKIVPQMHKLFGVR